MKPRGTFFWKQPQLTRRLFFRHAGSAVAGYFLLPSRPVETVARAAVTPIRMARNCIFVLMAGGPSHIDTFDLKTGPWTPGFMEPVEYNGLLWPRGVMPNLADQMDSIALLRSVRSWAAVHELARTWVQIGRNPVSGLSRIAPHIGSVVSLELGDRQQILPAFLSLNADSGPGQGYLAPEHSPFYIRNAGGNGLGNTIHRDGPEAFERRYNLLLEIDAENRREINELAPSLTEVASFNLSARKLMYNDQVNQVFRFDEETRSAFGSSAFGNACIVARNLLRANLGTRFIQIALGGWDHHSAIYTPDAALQALTRQFDAGLGKLIADLKTDGLLDETFIVAMGEFGRTVGEPNSQRGRDHFLQQAVLTAGARIKGGRAIGSTDSEGRQIADPGWSRNREIRAEDIEATIYSALGIDWTTIRRDDPLGRGFEYVPFSDRDIYGPVHELWT
jgi:hypothetical protein